MDSNPKAARSSTSGASTLLHEPAPIWFSFSAPPVSGTRPAIFLDRDGVINEQIVGGYVSSWSEFRFIPGIRSALATLSEIGLPIIVVSNQAGVGKGIVSATALAAITNQFVLELRNASARIDAVYYCPHIPADGCGCRKPRAGLLEEAAQEWRVDLSRSILIGNSMTDVQAARAVNCHCILWASGSMTTPSPETAVIGTIDEIVSTVQGFLQREVSGIFGSNHEELHGHR